MLAPKIFGQIIFAPSYFRTRQDGCYGHLGALLAVRAASQPDLGGCYVARYVSNHS
jgi:hypothetical protein